MSSLKTIFILTIWLLSCTRSQNQNQQDFRLVGGPCEGCEAVFEYANRILDPVDTLPGYHDQGQKIRVTGTIFEPDGTTPAVGVILYVYHTNQKGIYPTKGDETGWDRRHGYIRGWIKTGQDGRYAFYTLKPGIYPNRSAPAHIHSIILEPNGKYYWLEDYHFEGDSLLTDGQINPARPRGGSSGILSLRKEGEIYAGSRDIILGKNVPDY